ncbi:MAG: hypothetical protein ABIH23_30540 [bacterium]
MKESDRYVKIVEWSEEDQCYVGSCPGLFYGGCHGVNEQEVFADLCRLVEETIQLYRAERKPLPPPTSGKDYANKLLSVA